MSSPLNSNGPKLTIKMEDGKDKNSRDHMDIMRETEIKNDVSMHVPKAVEESNDERYETETSNTVSQTTAKRAIKKEDAIEVSMLLKKSSEEFKGTKSNVKVESNALKIKKEPKLKEKGGKKKAENKMKILAYLGEQLQSLNRTDISKQELAEVCGYARTGSHGFSYAYSELKEEGKLHTKTGKLTDCGIACIPKGLISFAKPKDNTEMQQHLWKLLRKKCKEGTDEKTKAIFKILSDGKTHELKEFTDATGYANLKSKGLGYNFTCMEKAMKILEKPKPNAWRFTNACFPTGRPE